MIPQSLKPARRDEDSRGMTLPATMRAMVLTGHGDLDKYRLARGLATPRPGPGEVLIRSAPVGSTTPM
jgi:hypothetical protein